MMLHPASSSAKRRKRNLQIHPCGQIQLGFSLRRRDQELPLVVGAA